MEGKMAVLTDKEQTLLRTVLPAGVATARTALAGVVGIYCDTEATRQGRFVGQQSAELCKGPAGGMAIRFPCFGRYGDLVLSLASFPVAFRPFANARKLFQTNQALGVGIQEVLGDRVVGAQLEPSLSLLHGEASPGCTASALALEPFLDTCVVISFGSYLLSGVELGVVLGGSDRGEIALAKINPQDLRQTIWCGVRGGAGERDQQIEAPFGAIIPEFGAADWCSLLEPGQMAAPALIGEDDATSQRQHADLPWRLEGEVASRDIGDRGRDVMRRFVQALEAFPGPTRLAGFHVFVPPGPEAFVGGAHLAEDTAGHLGRQAVPGPHLVVEIVVQAPSVGGLAMGKGVLAGLIQRITIRQLGQSQLTKLLRGGDQFQFGGDGGVHTLVFLLSSQCSEERAVLPPTPEGLGIRTATLMKHEKAEQEGRDYSAPAHQEQA